MKDWEMWGMGAEARRLGDAEMCHRILITNERGVVCDASVHVDSRKVTELLLDDEQAEPVMVGLAVLSGCVEAVLMAEFEKRNPDTLKREQRTTTSTRPVVPVCEGGCE